MLILRWVIIINIASVSTSSPTEVSIKFMSTSLILVSTPVTLRTTWTRSHARLSLEGCGDVCKLLRVINVVLLEHLIESDLVELVIKDILMLVKDMLHHELLRLESLLETDTAKIDLTSCDGLSLFLSVLVLHLFQDRILFWWLNFSDTVI